MAHRPNIVLRCTRVASGACLNAVCGLLWVVLLVVAVGLLVIRFRRDVEVPDFVLRRIEARLAEFQVRPTFVRSAFDPKGSVLVEGLKVAAESGSSPLIEIEAARARFNPWFLAVGSFDFDELELEGVRFNCPAELSRSGAAETLAGPGRLLIRRQGSRWEIVAAEFLVRGHRVHGRAQFEAVGSAGPALDPAQVLARYFQLCRDSREWTTELAKLEGARVELDLKHLAHGLTSATVHARAARIQAADGVVLQQAEVLLQAAGQSATRRLTGEAAISCDGATFAPDLTVRRLRTVAPFSLHDWQPVTMAGAWNVVADLVSFRSETLGAVRAKLNWDGRQRAAVELGGTYQSTPLVAAATGDVTDRSGELSFAGRLPPALVNEAVARIAAWRHSRFLSRVEVFAPTDVVTRVKFGPGFALTFATAQVAVGKAHASGVDMQEVGAEVTVDPKTVDVQRILLRREDAEVRGSYTMDLATQDYRFLLDGRLFPEAISSWFSEWWPRLWRDFDFRGVQPTTNVDVRGRWGFPHMSVVAGRLAAGPVRLRGVPMDTADVTFFVRPDHYDIVRFDARRTGQRAAGTFTRRDDLFTHQPRQIDFDFESNVPLEEGAVFFGPEGRETVKPYVFAVPPEVSARGRIVWRDGHGHEDINATARSPGEFRFEGFPVTNASLQFDLKENEIHLHEIAADLAGGRLVGKATVGGPTGGRRLAFEGALRGADLAGTIKTWNEFRAATGGEAATRSASVAANLGTNGKLDLELNATGPLDNLMGLRGTGKAAVTGAELGSVQMLGFLSRMLQGTLFGFTSLRFSNADAVFTVEEKDLNFSKLTFTGPSSRLESKGRYAMPDEKLDFHVTLRPFRESDFALAKVFSVVLEPLARVMEVRLTGTLEKPDWAFVAGPTNFFRSLESKNTPATPVPMVPLAPLTPAALPAPFPSGKPESPD